MIDLCKQGVQPQNVVSKDDEVQKIELKAGQFVAVKLPNGEHVVMGFTARMHGNSLKVKHDFVSMLMTDANGVPLPKKQVTRLWLGTKYCSFMHGSKHVEGLDGATVSASELAKARVVNTAGRPQVIA